MENKNAIILAMFGTSVEKALPGLLNIRDRMVDAFPAVTVRIAFTSKILRRIWHQRAADPQYCADHPEVPAEVFTVRDPLVIAADLRDNGYCGLVLQPVYMTPAEEYHGLLSAVESFRQENPLLPIAVGRPALGLFDTGTSADDMTAAARALACDAAYAREKNAALVYMGHGTGHESSPDMDVVYQEFAMVMHRLYPDTVTCVATVEGSLGLEKVVDLLRVRNQKKIVLKPLMVVAGNHVRRDMTGPEPRGWQTRMEHAGFTVEPVLKGLGEQDGFARIFVDHAFAAAISIGIQLR